VINLLIFDAGKLDHQRIGLRVDTVWQTAV